MRSWTLLVVVAGFGAGCASHPARFADRPAIQEVADDAPIPRPPRRREVDDFRATDEVVESAVVGSLDPRRWPEPGDANALDEVPRSSWFRPPGGPAATSFAELGPPVMPLTVLRDRPRSGRDGIAVLDARGLHYELRRDPDDRPEMRTAAAAIASRLVRGLGYLTPEAWIIEVLSSDLVVSAEPDDAGVWAAFLAPEPHSSSRGRVVAVRWPEGVDLGPTPMSGRRLGDPSDLVDHEDRRTLRALRDVARWLKIRRLAPDFLRDVYVGPAGRGHVEHALMGLDGALGADAVVRPTAPEEADSFDESTVRRALTLGLAPRSEAKPTQTRIPALGAIDAEIRAGDDRLQPPLLPAQRCSPADSYWLAKRIVALGGSTIRAAVEAGKLTNPEARDQLARILDARARALAAAAFAAVTPLEVERFAGQTLVVRDEALVAGFARPETTRYAVEILDGEGDPLAAPRRIAAETPTTAIALPPDVASRAGYVIVRVRVSRAGAGVSRAFEAHLRGDGAPLHLVGIRH